MYPKITERHVVVVGRRWDHPTIHIDVTEREIGISMPLSAFIAAVIRELEITPFTFLTPVRLKARIEEAATRVVAGMKDETSRIM